MIQTRGLSSCLGQATKLSDEPLKMSWEMVDLTSRLNRNLAFLARRRRRHLVGAAHPADRLGRHPALLLLRRLPGVRAARV